jgi:hypothetical protein
LIITGSHDNNVPTASLIIAGKIPGAWLVRIKDGHTLFAQYPDKVNKLPLLDFPTS